MLEEMPVTDVYDLTTTTCTNQDCDAEINVVTITKDVVDIPKPVRATKRRIKSSRHVQKKTQDRHHHKGSDKRLVVWSSSHGLDSLHVLLYAQTFFNCRHVAHVRHSNFIKDPIVFTGDFG